jgi:putative cell wall-binding protein
MTAAVAGAATAPAAATSAVATDRIAGADRYETAAVLQEIATATHCGYCPAAAAPILASGTTYADALGASNSPMNPILLTERDTLPGPTRSALQKYAAKADGNDPLIIAGGTAAISTAVEQQVQALGLTPYRLAGSDRYETAALFAGSESTRPDAILLASGEQFADALAAGPIIGETQRLGADQFRLVLTPHDHLAPAAQRLLKDDPTAFVVIVGGESAISSQVQTELGYQYRERIAGPDRYATAAKLADYLAQARDMTQQPAIDRVFLASGQSFPDALAAVNLVSRTGGAILLTESAGLPPATHDWLASHKADIARITAVGGPSAVSDRQLQQAGQAATS